MQKRYSFLSLIFTLTFFIGACSKQTAPGAGGGEREAVVQAAEALPVLSGQLSIQGGVSEVQVNLPVTFNIVASGGSSFRFVRSDNGSTILFTTSAAYTKSFTTVGVRSEAGVLQSLDASGIVVESITLSTPPFNVVAAPPIILSCSSLSATPTLVSVTSDANGRPVQPVTFQFKASTNEGAYLKSLETLSGVPIQVGYIYPSLQMSHLFYGTLQEFGLQTVKATFTNYDNEIAICQTNIEIRPIPVVTPPPRCTASASPKQVVEGQPFSVYVNATIGGPVSEIIVDGTKLAPGITSTSLQKPVGSYTIGVLVNGPGGSGSCNTNLVQVVPVSPQNPPACNFSMTRYPLQPLPVGASLLLSLTLNAGSTIPDSVLIDGVEAAKNPNYINRWDRTINFPNPGTFVIEGRATNSLGTGICWSNPISVSVAPILPTCTLTLSAPSAVEGYPITATLVHTNSAISGSANSATIAYAGSIRQTAYPYPSYSQTFIVKYPSSLVSGTVQTPAGVGSCLASFTPISGCSGLRLGGGCWYLGAYGQSCNSVCAFRGGYNPSDALYAHSQPTCTQVMTAFRVPNPYASVNPSKASGLSCFFYADTNSAWLHPAAYPTGSAYYPSARRACSCNL